jgi:hypothetical protein
MSFRRIKHFVVAAIAVGALAPAAAFGQSAAQDGYNPPAGQIQDEVAQQGGGPGGGAPGGGGPGGGDNAAGGGALPFTGMDLVLLLGGGGLLLSAGLGMRRLARRPDLA